VCFLSAHLARESRELRRKQQQQIEVREKGNHTTVQDVGPLLHLDKFACASFFSTKTSQLRRNTQIGGFLFTNNSRTIVAARSLGHTVIPLHKEAKRRRHKVFIAKFSCA